MMTVETFRRSPSDATPPNGLDLALQALWWTGKDDWDRAPGCVQQQEGEAACDRVHAYLHRVEGDLANAGYWYRRVGQAAATGPLDEEWSALVAHFLARPPGD